MKPRILVTSAAGHTGTVAVNNLLPSLRTSSTAQCSLLSQPKRLDWKSWLS